MIPMSELMRDRTYKAFLEEIPELPPIATNKRLQLSPPWVVYVQRKADGPWGKKEFWKYTKALKFLKKALALHVHDAALHCKRVSHKPPYRLARIKGKYMVGTDGVRRQITKRILWKPKLDAGDGDHYWCPFCRRPTELKYFRRHHALKSAVAIDTTVRRCVICGASERLIRA